MMKVLLLTKPNDTGRKAEAILRSKLPHTELEVIAAADRRLPTRTSWQCDWLISVLCPWVLPKAILEQAGNNFNIHPGPPEYPGFGCYNFAIYDRAAGYGVTCHRMSERVDSGEIIGVRRFKISPHIDIETLQAKSHAEILILFYDVLGRIGRKENLLPVEPWLRSPTSKRDFEALRRVPLNASSEEVERRVLAFGHRHFDGAYSALPDVSSDGA